jgi:hypothetical protein
MFRKFSFLHHLTLPKRLSADNNIHKNYPCHDLIYFQDQGIFQFLKL